MSPYCRFRSLLASLERCGMIKVVEDNIQFAVKSVKNEFSYNT